MRDKFVDFDKKLMSIVIVMVKLMKLKDIPLMMKSLQSLYENARGLQGSTPLEFVQSCFKVQSYKCVPAVRYLNRFKAYFPYAIVLMMLLNVGL